MQQRLQAKEHQAACDTSRRQLEQHPGVAAEGARNPRGGPVATATAVERPRSAKGIGIGVSRWLRSTAVRRLASVPPSSAKAAPISAKGGISSSERMMVATEPGAMVAISSIGFLWAWKTFSNTKLVKLAQSTLSAMMGKRAPRFWW